MKKLLVFCLTLILCLCCLASCDLLPKIEKFIPDETICSVEIETINYETGINKKSDKYILNEEQSNELKSLLNEITYVKRFNLLKKKWTHMNDIKYIFIFETQKVCLSENHIYIYDFNDILLKHIEFNSSMFDEHVKEIDEVLNNGSHVSSEKEHVHTGKWVEYDRYTHCYRYTCGCTLPDKRENHVNNNADIFCDICGYDLTEGPTETFFLKDYAAWLCALNAENVAEIKTTFEYIGVAPGNLKDIIRTTDKTVIEDILNKYKNIEMRSVFREETYISGGSAFAIEFILRDGTVKNLYFNNGFYAYGLYQDEVSALCYFELNYIPTLQNYDNITISNGFISYTGSGTIYDKDNNFVCQIPIDELEFIAFEDDLATVVTDYYYTINTEFGTLWFTYSNELFYLRGDSNDDCTEWYQLIGKNLDELISCATSNEYSLKMNDEEWLYENLKSTYRAGETVTVKINMAIDIGYLFLVNGKDIANCYDVYGLFWEFTFVMPECNVEIDFKTYDGFLPNKNYETLIETYWKQNLDSNYVYIENYYGEFSNSAIVAMISSGSYDEAVWEETVGDTPIRYNNGNRILVLYKGAFYTLTAAYENGYLSSNDLKVISDLQKEFYPFLY